MVGEEGKERKGKAGPGDYCAQGTAHGLAARIKEEMRAHMRPALPRGRAARLHISPSIPLVLACWFPTPAAGLAPGHNRLRYSNCSERGWRLTVECFVLSPSLSLPLDLCGINSDGLFLNVFQFQIIR
jgi:hypothetical protein